METTQAQQLKLNVTNINSFLVNSNTELRKLREKSKKKKYDMKNDLSDDARLLLLNLEANGFSPDMENFIQINSENNDDVNLNNDPVNNMDNAHSFYVYQENDANEYIENVGEDPDFDEEE